MTLLSLQQDFRTWLTSAPSEAHAQFGERARAGLAVYLNNYRSQLRGCLSASFPIVRAWIGDGAFEESAADHIDRASPHAWTLDAYGVDFPETLAQRYPGDPEIAELARLEHALAAIFVGADAEPLDPTALTDIDWEAAVIHFVPTFTHLSVTTNVAAIWSAINAEETPPPATRLPEPAHIAIWRDGFAPRFRTVPPEEAAILAQVLEGQTFGATCAALVARHGDEPGAMLASSFLSQWLSDRSIERIAC